jgi:hypothetical protein
VHRLSAIDRLLAAAIRDGPKTRRGNRSLVHEISCHDYPQEKHNPSRFAPLRRPLIGPGQI